MIQCDGYAAYGCIEDVILICCLAHARRKFFDAVPKGRQKRIRLLDINSEQVLDEPISTEEDENLLPAEKGVAFCNRLFFKERLYKELSPEERKAKRLEEETPIWDEFWSWIDTLDPSGGSKLEKAVKYALNHKESLMNYLLDGRCEISNNSAERKAKVYATGRKNFLFHDSVDGAKATAIVMSLVETAKANNLNAYKYLYTLLLYMPDYKNEPAGIEQLLPWSTFVQDKCSGIIDDSLELPENRGNLPIYGSLVLIPVWLFIAYHYSVRDNGVIRKLAAYVILGINTEGKKEVLSITVGDNESSKYWLSVLNELKNRGVNDILIICADGLSGIKEAIAAAFPKTEYQRCIVHQVRNTLKYVPDKDRKAFAADLKTIYHASDEEKARLALNRVTEKWTTKYPNSMKRWYDNWDAITPIFKFSPDVRKVIYTTNAIESLNSTYRKLNRQRSVFPSDTALLKALYLATFEATKRWTMSIRNWGQVYGELSIMYDGRLPE